ncbi:MAG: riboflavin synthase [Myxococcaceae bacterium]
MFTGLIQDVGSLEKIQSGGTTDFWIRTALGTKDFALGESIAVDGACLTVVKMEEDSFLVQAAPETLRRTTLGEKKPGAPVNLERALRLSDRLGGHLVSGHVDAVGELLARKMDGGSLVLTVSLPASLSPFFLEKGSVTLDGVSLTLVSVEADRFTVMLIPETQQRTTLAQKTVGAKLNLEADLIGKYVARLYGQRHVGGAGLSEQTLRAAGLGSPLDGSKAE